MEHLLDDPERLELALLLLRGLSTPAIKGLKCCPSDDERALLRPSMQGPRQAQRLSPFCSPPFEESSDIFYDKLTCSENLNSCRNAGFWTRDQSHAWW
jgi:hypothetical protein